MEEEKRELPDGVHEEMGACIFCGQTYMFANVSLGTEQLNEAATEKCNCEEAKEWRVKRNRSRKIHKKVDKIFTEEKYSKFMSLVADMVLVGSLKKVAVEMDTGETGTISITSKGAVKIQRSRTTRNTAEA